MCSVPLNLMVSIFILPTVPLIILSRQGVRSLVAEVYVKFVRRAIVSSAAGEKPSKRSVRFWFVRRKYPDRPTTEAWAINRRHPGLIPGPATTRKRVGVRKRGKKNFKKKKRFPLKYMATGCARAHTSTKCKQGQKTKKKKCARGSDVASGRLIKLLRVNTSARKKHTRRTTGKISLFDFRFGVREWEYFYK